MRIATPLLVVIATLLLPATCLPQVTQNWISSNSATAAYNPAITTDASGNLYVAGTTGSSYMLIKYNASGVKQWGIVGLVGSSNGVVGLGHDNAGNVYLVTNAGSGILVAAFNPSGSALWGTTLRYSGLSAIARAMAVDGAGNVYIGGQMYTASSPHVYNYMTIKVSGGVQQWLANFEGTATESGQSLNTETAIAADASGNVYVTGISSGAHVYISGTGRGIHTIKYDSSYDITTIKYDPSGNALWTNTFDEYGGSMDYGFGLALDPTSGNVYVSGQSVGSSITSDLIAYSSAGTQLWLNQSGDFGYMVAKVDPAGNIITGSTYGSGDFTVSKFTSAGSLTWTYTNTTLLLTSYALIGNLCLALDNHGNCYVTGPTTAYNSYVTAEISSAGSLIWSTTYNSGPNGSSGIAVFTPTPRLPGQPAYPEITVTGTGGSNANFTTIQYTYAPTNELAASTPNSLTSLTATLATPAIAQLSNYPNPFHGTTTIAYTIPDDSHVTLQLYDGAGRTVATLVDEDETAGAHTIPFNAGRLATGTYAYRIVALSPQGTFTQTKQMIIQ